MTALLTPNDKARHEAWKRKDRELAAGILERLSHERKPSCRIVYERGKPMFDIGGRLYETMYYNTSENWNDHNFKLKEQVGYFRDAGIHVYGIGYKTADIWKPDGSIDFQKVYDRLLDALMDDPDAYFMYCIATDNPPKWWCKAHPEEITGYANGTPDFECNVEIKNIAAPSMASKLWMKDVADFQRRMVEWLEASPFASRIFAYRTDYGVHHEWHYYGMTEYMPDNSLPMTIAFRNWLRENYKDDVSALRRAWHDETVAFETANVPPPADRNRTSAGILRDPAKDRPSVDYQRCHAQVVRICLLNSNRTIKEACGGYVPRPYIARYGGDRHTLISSALRIFTAMSRGRSASRSRPAVCWRHSVVAATNWPFWKRTTSLTISKGPTAITHGLPSSPAPSFPATLCSRSPGDAAIGILILRKAGMRIPCMPIS